jgi:tRNA threonylcarbamoyladenosine biosynthesis protein TsaE
MKLASVQETEAAGEALARALEVGDVIALSGELGAGKTTLARGLAHALGFAGEVSSPTFPIVQVYDEPEMRLPLWHVDLYRIEDTAALAELGLDEAREHAALVIEWPERLGAQLWRDSLRLEIHHADSGIRVLTASVPPAWEGRCPVR